MKAYVIKRDDGKYFTHNGALVMFVDDLIDADLYRIRLGAENTMQWIIDNEWRYCISKEQVQVVAIEIKEIQEQ